MNYWRILSKGSHPTCICLHRTSRYIPESVVFIPYHLSTEVDGYINPFQGVTHLGIEKGQARRRSIEVFDFFNDDVLWFWKSSRHWRCLRSYGRCWCYRGFWYGGFWYGGLWYGACGMGACERRIVVVGAGGGALTNSPSSNIWSKSRGRASSMSSQCSGKAARRPCGRLESITQSAGKPSPGAGGRRVQGLVNSSLQA